MHIKYMWTFAWLPALLIISQTAAGVAGTIDLWSRHNFPIFTIWKPSTSFSGAMALHTARSLMWSKEERNQNTSGMMTLSWKIYFKKHIYLIFVLLLHFCLCFFKNKTSEMSL